MYRKVSLITLILVLFFGFSAEGRAYEPRTHYPHEPRILASWESHLKQSLASLAKEAEANEYCTGMCVWDLTSDALLFEYNQHKVMRPASTQKVVTAVSMLSLLGADYKYCTRAYYSGNISADGILHGDIYVVGDFDPAYSYSDIKELAQSVRKLNIKGIDGKLYADISMKDSLLYGSGWCWDDVPTNNTPYLCPLMVERGKMYPDWSKYSSSASFHPAMEFLRTFGRELKDIRGDKLACSLRSIDKNTSCKLFYTKTRTVAELLPHMMKTSDNFYAESMFYHLASINKSRWATAQDGAKMIESVLLRAKSQTQNVNVADGSGVSLYNYLTPRTELDLLRYAYKNQEVFNVLYSSLPIAGVDGTLKSRMTAGNAYNNVHAKTGTLTGVVGLSGYVTASNGHLLAFCIINNGVLKLATGRAFQDRVCQVLAK